MFILIKTCYDVFRCDVHFLLHFSWWWWWLWWWFFIYFITKNRKHNSKSNKHYLLFFTLKITKAKKKPNYINTKKIINFNIYVLMCEAFYFVGSFFFLSKNKFSLIVHKTVMFVLNVTYFYIFNYIYIFFLSVCWFFLFIQ